MPGYEAEMADFERYDAQVVGISVDSVPSHIAFAKSLGGIEHYPLLADFHPKGEVSKKYGVWKDDKGFSERAIVVVDQLPSPGLVAHDPLLADAAHLVLRAGERREAGELRRRVDAGMQVDGEREGHVGGRAVDHGGAPEAGMGPAVLAGAAALLVERGARVGSLWQAAALGMDRATMMSVTDRLEDRGLGVPGR